MTKQVDLNSIFPNFALVGRPGPSVFQAAVAGGRDFDLDSQLEVPERAASPSEESVEPERAVSLAG
jgi:hypothetical protein